MNNINYIRTFEYDSIYNENKNGVLTKPQFDALVKFNDKNDNKYFTVIHNGIKFKQYVGVLRVNNLTIEILPKIDKEKNADLAHELLIKMLRVCRKLNISSVSKANLKIKYNNLLEYYLELYLQELSILLKRGLVKKYRFQEENKNVLKGKLLTSKQIRENLIHKERFFIRYQKYDFNHLLNKVLAEALRVIPSITNNQSLLSFYQQTQLAMPEIESIKLSKTLLDSITYDRKTERYKNAVELAKLILMNYTPDLITGRNNLIAILFDMNKLYEEYIYRMLKRESKDFVKVEMQKRRMFWKHKSIRPDILLTKGKRKVIIDTKWKILRDLKPADDDLKQMFVYNEYFDSYESVLLYPRMYFDDSIASQFQNKSHGCRLEFVDLTLNGKINQNIGKEVLQLIDD